MQRIDLYIAWREKPIQFQVNKVKSSSSAPGNYSVTFEDEDGGEGKILFNQNSVAAVVVSPPTSGPGQGAQEGDPNYGLPDAPTHAAVPNDVPRGDPERRDPQELAEESRERTEQTPERLDDPGKSV